MLLLYLFTAFPLQPGSATFSPSPPLPSRWAMSEGYGAHLISHPELVADMIQQACSRSGLPVSIKIRVHQDLRYGCTSEEYLVTNVSLLFKEYICNLFIPGSTIQICRMQITKLCHGRPHWRNSWPANGNSRTQASLPDFCLTAVVVKSLFSDYIPCLP